MQTQPQNTHTSSPQSQMLRPIIPAPISTFSPTVPISPAISPHVAPSPHNINGPQMGVLTLPPFKTPPVSPFSNPMSNERSVQSVFKLPPPLQALPPIQIQPQPQQGIVPPSPISQRDSNNLAETARYERILPKQSTINQTSVFSVPLAPAPNGVTSSTTASSRPAMLHHTSSIHSHTSHHSTSGQLSGGVQHLTTADQREIARKVSHSAIERRRRERINDKIMQLKELIPSCADQDHLHKLNILQSAIEYIEYLQGLIAESRRRERSNGDDGECGRVRKRSKFDRYEILPLSSSSKSRRGYQSRTDDSDGYRSKRDSITSISSGSSDTPERRNSEQQSLEVSISNTATSPISSPIPENDNVLLLLSAAEVSERNNQKGKGAEKPTKRDTETQVTTLDLDEFDLDRPMKTQNPNKDHGNWVGDGDLGEGGKRDDDSEDEGGEGSKVPRRGMTVQNLLS